ncbi:Protein CBG18842 [Caenorhabditis briggsae]|uniref:Uncharacterized protein n=2 Tax=Caenorhabditis briggsae TaxID=6238 RepID=A0AAE9DZ17_CAEBR|nr:Protein CBG18842 [Caenorhabditis briggsae]ULU13791.1 hypothetical protein L3Y34_016351 [Caenorhabditis briggsae]UMM14718.1 hypothetical protein L5515_002415 [Caenorhabditis briggsae]CAP36201.2 Protein CBG18842 [Caenorhabditis briggsae]
MSRFVFFVLVLALTMAVTIAEPDNSRKFRSCGFFLNLRIDRVCGGTCSMFYDALHEIACSTGITDNHLVQICCPSLQ